MFEPDFCFGELFDGAFFAFFSRYLVYLKSINFFFLKCCFFSCRIERLAELGKNYPWPIPPNCPKCHGRIWKHGFTKAYFYPIQEPLDIQRLICPDCGAVFRFRPNGYLPYCGYPLVVIFLSLFGGKSENASLDDINPETRVSWLKRLKKQVKLTLARLTSKDYKKGFLDLLERGFHPVSYPPNLRIASGFRLPTEVHLFSG